MARLPQRKGSTRRPHNVVIVVTEGRTERMYFNGLKERNCNVVIKTPGSSDTDAVNLVRFCIRQMSENGLDTDDGDLAICVFDVDENPDEHLRKAADLAERNGVILAVSNPCFELWLALHFTDIGRQIDRKEVHALVCRNIKGYSKTKDHNDVLAPLRRTAVLRAERLWVNDANADKVSGCPSNPSTGVHIAIKRIEELKRRNILR